MNKRLQPRAKPGPEGRVFISRQAIAVTRVWMDEPSSEALSVREELSTPRVPKALMLGELTLCSTREVVHSTREVQIHNISQQAVLCGTRVP